jgi:membrane-bound lytic murein transglycosylase B
MHKMALAAAILFGAGAAYPETLTAVSDEVAMTVTGTDAGLQTWIVDFRPRALAAGIDAATFDTAFRNAAFDPVVIDRDRNQGEFTRTIWDYLDRAVSDLRVTNGQEMLAKHRALLDRIEATYHVDREIVVAVWGLESSYGAFMGDHHLMSSLASLAYDGRRGAFFEGQLIAALKILQNGDVTPERMTGSWAGAMGHTQFMPTSYLASAVDFTGDGRRDIWADDPGDALASTAAYLAKAGWVFGRPWGMEVTLPADFDYDQSGDRIEKPVADWKALGVRLADGGDLPDHGPAKVLLPAGASGAAFLIFANFRAIEAYNAADAYVIGIGHLADRLRGGAPFKATWPRHLRAMPEAERIELQRLLTAAGFDTGGADGKIGPLTVAAVKAYQRANALTPDGYASPDILDALR